MKRITTEELNKLARNGDDESIGKLYENLFPLSVHIARSYARVPADAEEMAGDCSTILLDCIEAHDPDRPGGAGFKTYFIRAFHHHCMKYYRRNRPNPMCDLDTICEEGPETNEDFFDLAPEDGTVSGQLIIEAAAFAETLPATQKDILLDLLNGASLAAVADGMGLSFGDARMRLKRAVEALVIHLQIHAPHLSHKIPEGLHERFSGGDKPLFS